MGKYNSGFTLAELSIVIVIIALVMSGVIVGRDLIKSSEIRKSISILEKVNAAVNTFKIKYGCIPGDCTNTTSLFSGTWSAYNGNGDGLINRWPNESMAAHDSLVAANFIPKTAVKYTVGHAQNSYLAGANDSWSYLYYADLYSIALDGTWTFGNPTILPNAIKAGVTVTWANWTGGGSINQPAISPNDASMIDQKIDDGLPKTGKFFGHNSSGLCTITGQNAYQVSDVIGCRIVYYLPGN